MRTTIAKAQTALKQVAMGGVLAAIATTGYAANQGSVGFNSTGDLTITMNVNDDVRISALADLDFGDFTGTGDTRTSPACIYRNAGTLDRDYQVTAVGSGPGGAFVLTGVSGATIAYTVTFTDLTTAPTTSTALTSGTPIVGSNAEPTTDCNSGADNNAEIVVDISTAAASAAPADAYTGLLTLTVAPD